MSTGVLPAPEPLEVEKPKPSADYPEYWLGQLKTIDQQERIGVLTKAQTVSELHRVMDELKGWDKHKISRTQGHRIGLAQIP